MAGDPELYAKMKAGCRQVTDQLSWDRVTERMESYYADVLEQRDASH